MTLPQASILPIGLSFHVFQSLAYTLEVYKGRFKAERHLGIFAVYVLYFPQMVAGPIERPQNIIPQLKLKHEFKEGNAWAGFHLILWGFVMKTLIADPIALKIDAFFKNPSGYGAVDAGIAIVLFAVQIYCDFAGYSNIARGSSLFFGVDLMKNFNFPYFSVNISDFWRRWHISLSTWFRDYVYIPLGGNRLGSGRTFSNQWAVFLLSGLWHGASWNFVIWGALHGIYINIHSLFSKRKINLHPFVSWLVTFTCVCFAWIFFRAQNLESALQIIRQFSVFKKPSIGLTSLLPVFCLISIEYIFKNKDAPIFERYPLYLRMICYLAALTLFWFFGSFSDQQFIYFQF